MNLHENRPRAQTTMAPRHHYDADHGSFRRPTRPGILIQTARSRLSTSPLIHTFVLSLLPSVSLSCCPFRISRPANL